MIWRSSPGRNRGSCELLADRVARDQPQGRWLERHHGGGADCRRGPSRRRIPTGLRVEIIRGPRIREKTLDAPERLTNTECWNPPRMTGFLDSAHASSEASCSRTLEIFAAARRGDPRVFFVSGAERQSAPRAMGVKMRQCARLRGRGCTAGSFLPQRSLHMETCAGLSAGPRKVDPRPAPTTSSGRRRYRHVAAIAERRGCGRAWARARANRQAKAAVAWAGPCRALCEAVRAGLDRALFTGLRRDRNGPMVTVFRRRAHARRPAHPQPFIPSSAIEPGVISSRATRRRDAAFSLLVPPRWRLPTFAGRRAARSKANERRLIPTAREPVQVRSRRSAEMKGES